MNVCPVPACRTTLASQCLCSSLEPSVFPDGRPVPGHDGEQHHDDHDEVVHDADEAKDDLRDDVERGEEVEDGRDHEEAGAEGEQDLRLEQEFDEMLKGALFFAAPILKPVFSGSSVASY